MFNSRESIYAALYAKISNATGFQTISRRLQHWDDVSPSAQPALYQAQIEEQVATVPGLDPVFVLGVDLYIYVNTQGDATVSPASLINPLLDSVLATLAPDPVTNKQTLGGLVEWCEPSGRIQTDEGVLANQGVAIIRINMKAL